MSYQSPQDEKRLQHEEDARWVGLIIGALIIGSLLGSWWSARQRHECSELFRKANADAGSEAPKPFVDCTMDFQLYVQRWEDLIATDAKARAAVDKLETRVADLQEAKERSEDRSFVHGYNKAGRDTCERIYRGLAAVFSLEDGHRLSYADCLRDFAFRYQRPD